MVYVLLADGFEEMEAIAPIDLLRRVGCELQTVAIGSATLQVTGAHGITVTADIAESDVVYDGLQAVILPGGMPGTLNLEASGTVQKLLDVAVSCDDTVIAAICAAPSVLGHKGILQGKKAVCYPGFEKELIGAVLQDTPVAVDGRIITSKGAGTATDFALALVKALVGEEAANRVREGIQCK